MLLKSDNCECVNRGYMVSLNVMAMEFPFHLISAGHVEAPIPFFTTRSERSDCQLIYTRSGTASITYKRHADKGQYRRHRLYGAA